ncbi:MAG: prolipoprotein diacylglyceryl transferase [Clostridiales Family XIII bacterium]|jgi:phosphatidylglycerol:prolipoprotein diacylglycerol transferase|nr:prolipoprotein diacylglyceryl transferase [Clostridiales Family XIII bacterium]
MFPFIDLGFYQLPTYGLSILVGLLLAFFFLWKFPIKKSSNIKKDDCFYAFIFGLIGVFLGAKLLYILVNLSEIIAEIKTGNTNFKYISEIFFSGFVFYGGLIGGIIGVFIYTKIYKFQFLEMLDKLIFIVPLMHAFGRIGCFLAGCCYGTPVHFGLEFNESPFAPHNEKLLPTQLIEAIFNFLLFILLFYLSHKKDALLNKKNGYLVFIYLPIYAIMRFILEFFRYDSLRGIYFNLSTSQWISIALIIITAIYWINYKKNPIIKK